MAFWVGRMVFVWVSCGKGVVLTNLVVVGCGVVRGLLGTAV